MILEQLQLDRISFLDNLARSGYRRYWVNLIPDTARSVTGSLKLSRTRNIKWCVGSHLNVPEIGVSGLIFYAVDQAGAGFDTARQMTNFAAGALPESVHINVTDRPITCHGGHTVITTPIIKAMIEVWLLSHDGKVEAPLDPSGQLKICLCLGVPLDTQTGEGIYLLADKDLKLSNEQERLRLKLRRKLKAMESELKSIARLHQD